MTPAMAAGISGGLLEMTDIVRITDDYLAEREAAKKKTEYDFH